MKNHFFYSFLVFFVFQLVFCQKQQIDSLKNIILETKNDSLKCQNLLLLLEKTDGIEQEKQLATLFKTSAKNINANKNQKYFKSCYVNALSYRATIEMKIQNNGKQIFKTLDEALKIATEIKDFSLISMVYNNKGYYLQIQGNYSEAVQSYFKAIQYLDKIKDFKGKLESLVNVAAIYMENQEYDLALKYYFQCVEIEKKTPSPKMLAIANNFIGEIYIKKKEFKLAKKYLTIAQKIEEGNKLIVQAASTFNNLGFLEIALQNPKKAIIYFESSLKLSLPYAPNDFVCVSYLGIAKAYRYLKNPKKAIEFGLQSLEMAKLGKLRLNICQASQELVLAYKLDNNFKQAFLMQEIFAIQNDSLKNEKTDKVLLRSQYKYEYDSKAINDSLKVVVDKKITAVKLEKQKNQKLFFGIIALVVLLSSIFVYRKYLESQKQKSKIQKQAETIQTSLIEKEILLKEIHHRVKNNLQVISSLLGLQSSKIEDARLKAIFAESKNKINTISLIHQKLYQNDNLAAIEMNDYFESLYAAIYSVFSFNKDNISLTLNTNAIHFDIDTSVPLGLIFNELITNALKYAFAENQIGTISVELKNVNEGIFELTISDNGTGFDKNFQNKNSLGLNLVNMLAAQLNGNFVQETNAGTKNTITFEDTNQRKKVE